jgi:hypothetical protein
VVRRWAYPRCWLEHDPVRGQGPPVGGRCHDVWSTPDGCRLATRKFVSRASWCHTPTSGKNPRCGGVAIGRAEQTTTRGPPFRADAQQYRCITSRPLRRRRSGSHLPIQMEAPFSSPDRRSHSSSERDWIGSARATHRSRRHKHQGSRRFHALQVGLGPVENLVERVLADMPLAGADALLLLYQFPRAANTTEL